MTTVSAAASLLLAYCKTIPERVHDCLSKTKSGSSVTLLIVEFDNHDYKRPNDVYYACRAYLESKLGSTMPNVSLGLAVGKYSDSFKDIQLHWSFGKFLLRPWNKYFELVFNPEHRDMVFGSYLPLILKFYDDGMMNKKKDLQLFTHKSGGYWKPVEFKQHPLTFDVVAMDPEMKRAVVDDLDRFLRSKELYKKVGRGWTRGYLLYGPPGTGKSSLIAAISNYLSFDIYDLQLSRVFSDSEMRGLIESTPNKSVLVIEDFDCTLGLTPPGAKEKFECDRGVHQVSFSGALNYFNSSLWSSCVNERIIIFTTTTPTNKLDPALLRPGLVDMHVTMSYLTMHGFRILASNYLGISHHPLFGEIESLLQTVNVTTAQVALELSGGADAESALHGLVLFLKTNKSGGGWIAKRIKCKNKRKPKQRK